MKFLRMKNLFVVLAVACSLCATASDNITGTKPTAGTFGLFNVEQGQFLTVSGGKPALADGRGSLVTLALSDAATGSYTLDVDGQKIVTTFQGDVTLGAISEDNGHQWMFNPVKGEDNVYTLGCRDNAAGAVDYLYYSTLTNSFANSYAEPTLGGYWKLVAEQDIPWIITLDENSEEYKAPAGTESYEVHLKRTFTIDSWNTICLPFSIDNATLKQVFGDDVQLVEPGAVNEAKATVIFSNADRIDAGYTYLIKPAEHNEGETSPSYYVFDNVKAFADKAVQQNIVGGVVFEGSFAKTTAPTGKYVIRKNKVYQLTSDMPMKGFRAYFGPKDNTKSPLYFWTIEEDDPTGIDEVIKRRGAVDIYTVSGELVRSKTTSTQGLLRGIYVVDGQKVLVK